MAALLTHKNTFPGDFIRPRSIAPFLAGIDKNFRKQQKYEKHRKHPWRVREVYQKAMIVLTGKKAEEWRRQPKLIVWSEVALFEKCEGPVTLDK